MTRPGARKTVTCTNEDCPEVLAKGRPWLGQRAAHRAEEDPCPKCSSSVTVMREGSRGEAVGGLIGIGLVGPLEVVALLDLDASAAAIATPTAMSLPLARAAGLGGAEELGEQARQDLRENPVVLPARIFTGVPRHELGGVRVGMAARQRLAKEAGHRKTLEQRAAEVLDAWAAGLLDPQGAA